MRSAKRRLERLERLERVDKPWQPWRLQLELGAGARGGDAVAELRGAVVERGGFSVGPVDLDLRHGDRLAIVGPNGSGKTTLLRALLGELPLARGTRHVGPSTRFGVLEQDRSLFDRDEPVLRPFAERAGLREQEALEGYAGTVVLVTHDRRFLEAFEPTRTLGV